MESKDITKFVTDKAVALIKALHNPPIGAKEFSGGWCPERCDAILFDSNNSFMIETKISRSDFLADFKKEHRKNGGLIGNYRYYACPAGLIKPEEIPEKWGLIYVDLDNKRSRAKMPIGYGGFLPKSGQSHLSWKHQKEHELYGCPNLKEEDFPQLHWKEVYNHPEQPKNKYYFPNTGLERNYLFALATRYKSQKFMDNIL